MLDVRNFGAVGDGEADDSASVQAAIDFAVLVGGHVYIPKSVYRADGLVLRTGVKIVGDGREQSVIMARSGSGSSGVFVIDSGITQDVLIKDIGIRGGGNVGQHGLHFWARRHRDDGASGLWHSNFDNVRVSDFDGAQVWLQGGGVDSLDPIQFLEFRHMVVERIPTVRSSIGVLMSGQVNQTRWVGGRCDGFGASAREAPGVNLKICRQLSDYDPRFDGSSAYISPKSGHSHSFYGVSFQQSELAIYLDRVESVTFDGCHFEGLSRSVLVNGASAGVRIDRCHFANAGLAPNSTAITVEASSSLSARGNWFGGNNGTLGRSDGGSARMEFSESFGMEVSSTINSTRQVISSRSLSTAGSSTALVQSSSEPVATLLSSLAPGELLTLRALGGPIVFVAGGNIGIPSGVDSLVIGEGEAVCFTRFDRGSAWVPLNLVRTGNDVAGVRLREGWVSGFGTSVSSASFPLGSMRGSRLPVGPSMVVVGIGCEVVGVGGAGSVIRLGLYRVGESADQLVLVLDCGVVDGESTGFKSISFNTVIDHDVEFYGVAVSQGGSPPPTVRSVGGADQGIAWPDGSALSVVAGVGIQSNKVFSELPPATAAGLVGSVPRVLVQRASLEGRG